MTKPVIPLHRLPDEDAPADPRRRTLLASMAAAAALAAAGCKGPPTETIHPYVAMPEGAAGGDPVFYASSLVRNAYAQGVLVETHDGRPTKIEGNPMHPGSRGATDIYMQASILQLWDSDRSRLLLHGNEAADWDALRAAIRAHLPTLQARQGSGFHVLTGELGSPTLLRQLEELQRLWPAMHWYVHAPLADTAAQMAHAELAGMAGRPYYRFADARLVLSLDADLLNQGPDCLRQARELARARSRGCVVLSAQSTPSHLGIWADERHVLRIDEIVMLTTALARALAAPTMPGTPTPGTPVPKDSHVDAAIATLAQAWAASLRTHAGRSVLAAGPHLPRSVHRAVWWINQRLGNLGRSIDVLPAHAGPQPVGGLPELEDAIDANEVDTLLILDANPAYDATASRFSAALPKVPLSVHVGMYRDETAHLAQWHVPALHPYEGWSDGRAYDGTASIVQPVIQPLHSAHSPHAVLSLFGDREQSAHALVRETWQAHWNAALDSEDRWREALRTGVIVDSAPPPLAPSTPWTLPPVDWRAASVDGAAAVGPPSTPYLTAILTPAFGVDDGAYANNAWLQELPHPFTRIVWDNAATLGPGTARALGVESGDMLELSPAESGAARTAVLQVPVFVQEDQAEGSVLLPAGYGRKHAGRVGTDVGFNAYAMWRPARREAQPEAPRLQPVHAKALRQRHVFARSQIALSVHGRDLVRTEPWTATPPPDMATREVRRHASLYPATSYPDHAWAMNIDLDACTGCNVCSVACQAENSIPVVGKEEVAAGRIMQWIRVDFYQDAAAGEPAFQPVPCMHCENAPCEEVCPVGATVHDSEGLNAQVYNRCIGTRFCSNNCPYKVRRFNFRQYAEVDEYSRAQRNPQVTVRERGVMEKCTYCVQRISRARIDAQTSGRPLQDGDVRTACQAACPTQAIQFGDLNDPGSALNRERRERTHYALLGELNTEPRTRYFPRRTGRMESLPSDPPSTETGHE